MENPDCYIRPGLTIFAAERLVRELQAARLLAPAIDIYPRGPIGTWEYQQAKGPHGIVEIFMQGEDVTPEQFEKVRLFLESREWTERPEL